VARPSKERAKRQAVARTRKASIPTTKTQVQEPSPDARLKRAAVGKPESTAAKRVAGKVASHNRNQEGKAEARDAGSEAVTIDRRRKDRRNRDASNGRRRGSSGAHSQCDGQGNQGGERRKLERRAKVNRRRQIDPTTCERDYSQDEIEFMAALDAYKRTSGRMFPTCSEVLEVLRGLGYEKRSLAPPTQEETPTVVESARRAGRASDALPTFPLTADAAFDAMIPVPAGA
jgi:hypothetical protein